MPGRDSANIDKAAVRYDHALSILAPLLIFGVLIFVYKDAVLHHYYFSDDEHIYPEYLQSIFDIKSYFKFGRPIADLLLYLSVWTYRIDGSVRIAHFINIALLSGLIYCIFVSLKRVWLPWQAIGAAIVIGCLPSFQIHITFARIFSYIVGYILCYFAVEIVYRQKDYYIQLVSVRSHCLCWIPYISGSSIFCISISLDQSYAN